MQYFKKYAWVYILALAAVWALSSLASESVTLVSGLLETEPEAGKRTVVIDPGHGGEDGGAISCTGVRESRINLEIGTRLNDLLLLLGCETRMTRTEDVSIHSDGAATVSEKKVSDLKNRVRLVEETHGAVLVSIHQNMFEESQYRGAQVFYARTTGSGRLAALLQRRLRESLDPENHREEKESQTVYLMNKITCPGVLIECGFLSNPREELLLRSAGYQKQLSCVIGAGLLDYLNQTEEGTLS